MSDISGEQQPPFTPEAAGAPQQFDPAQPNMGDETPLDRATALERLKNIDRHDVLVAATIVGGVAAALASGTIAVKKLKNGRLSTPEGSEVAITLNPDRILKGIASIVELKGKSGDEGIAVSAPISSRIAEHLTGKDGNNDRALFFMRPKKRISYLLRHDEESDAYSTGIRKAAGWLMHALSSSEKDGEA